MRETDTWRATVGIPRLDVDGKVAVVTGAAQGIGAAYARGLAEAGARVVLVDIDRDGGEATAASIRADGLDARFIETDVAERASVDQLAEIIDSEYGGAHILVNNAAFEGAPTPELIEDLDPDKFDRVMAVNVKGMWILAQALLAGMKARDGAAIVNQSSIGAFVGYPGTAPYAASKMGIIGITRVLARELGVHGIRVNCIAPGVVATESTLAHTSTDTIDQIIASQCIRQMQRPSDLVGPLLFLVTDASKFITGQTLVVDGGVVLSP